jgi:hypothetical protein
MIGEINCAASRPFLPPISSDERKNIRRALIDCGLLKKSK